MNSQWLRTYSKFIKLIPYEEARSLGDCLRNLEKENIINHNFLLLYGNGTLLTSEKLNTLFSVHNENIRQDRNCIMTLVYRQLNSNHFEHPSYTDDQHVFVLRDNNTHRVYDYSNEYLDKYKISLDLFKQPNITMEILYCTLDCRLAICSPDVLHLFQDNFDFLTINEFVQGVLFETKITGHTIYSHLYETGYFLSVHNLRLYMKATFDILRRWSYPLVPEIISSMDKQLFSIVTTLVSSQIKLNDSDVSFYNISYPIIYDKHNIYKQGDIKLDRLSNIEQDVFIGHNSQILSGVYLRRSCIGQNCIIGKNTQIINSILWNHVQIGENCIIKNSIICNNVLIRNNVQIDKECMLCENVIIGTNVHLNQRMIIIASNFITSTGIIDEIEIIKNDDISISSENVKCSNSKQRSNSTSSSEKFINSSNEEIIVSNSDLVGIDGFGKELIFNSVHDGQAENFEDTDNDEDDDSEDDDKNQLNAFDAWGYRIERRENRGSSVISDDDFQEEVIRTLKRAYKKNLKPNNIIDELNILKPTYNVSPTEFEQSIIRAIFLLPLENQIANPEQLNYWNTLKLTMDKISQTILKNYMKITNEQAQMLLLNEIDLICLEYIQLIGVYIANILMYLYDNDVIDEQWILKWYENKQEKIKNNQLIIKLEEEIYYDKLKQFVEWLQNAESDV
ncbi:unnamed protein product [Rotaria sordida]|nr:unnamed protein product [Rotaria sordida]